MTTAGVSEDPSPWMRTVKCCKCGRKFPQKTSPSSSNSKAECTRCTWRFRKDVTRLIPHKSSIVYCPGCSTYANPIYPSIRTAPGSKQHLLRFLVNIIPVPRSVQTIRTTLLASSTHPTRTITVKLLLRGEISPGQTVSKRSVSVRFSTLSVTCQSCSAKPREQEVVAFDDNSDHQQPWWLTKVELRQCVAHHSTLFSLQKLILRYHWEVADAAARIQHLNQGVDFFFLKRSNAVKLVGIVSAILPVQVQSSEKTLAVTCRGNSNNNKTKNRRQITYFIEICPICRNDLICLPPTISSSLGNLGPVVVCTRVTNHLELTDPLTLRTASLDAEAYWRLPFKAMLSYDRQVEYIVLDVMQLEDTPAGVHFSQGYGFAIVKLARVSDPGRNEFMVRTHLGHFFQPGHYAIGYDLRRDNITDHINANNYQGLVIPEAILIKRSFSQQNLTRMGELRDWKQKGMSMEIDGTVAAEGKLNDEYEQFLRDLEENADMTLNISL